MWDYSASHTASVTRHIRLASIDLDRKIVKVCQKVCWKEEGATLIYSTVLPCRASTALVNGERSPHYSSCNMVDNRSCNWTRHPATSGAVVYLSIPMTTNYNIQVSKTKNMFFPQNSKRGMGRAWQFSPSPMHAMDMFLCEVAAIFRILSLEQLLSSDYGKLQGLCSFSLGACLQMQASGITFRCSFLKMLLYVCWPTLIWEFAMLAKYQNTKLLKCRSLFTLEVRVTTVIQPVVV